MLFSIYVRNVGVVLFIIYSYLESSYFKFTPVTVSDYYKMTATV